MVNRRGIWMAAAIAATLALGTDARAEFCNFDYFTTVTAVNGTTVPAPPAPGNSPTSAAIILPPVTNPANTLTFAGKAETTLNAAIPGGTNIQFMDILFTPSSTTPQAAASYDARFAFRITIEDNSLVMTGGEQQSITGFGGLGGFYQGEPNGAFNDARTPLFYFFGSTGAPTTTQTLTFTSGAVYTITVKNANSPGGGGPEKQGGLTANVTCAPAGVIPEPSSVVLMSLGGVGALGLVGLRRRKAKV